MSNEIALQNFQDSLDTQMRRAELMSKANMIPDKFKGQPANVLVAQEIATSMGESTWWLCLNSILWEMFQPFRRNLCGVESGMRSTSCANPLTQKP